MTLVLAAEMDGYEEMSVSQRMHAVVGGRLRGKVFNDPIHELIKLRPESVRCIDSQPFQRLRDLKQLGLSYYVFPGASHHRFEHSLGVAHLANRIAMHLKISQPDLGITESDLKVVEVAGLCHDLGHGPFSHVFDNEFLKQEGVEGWSHEVMSCEIFDMIVAEKGLLNDEMLTEEEVDRVKAMILAGAKGVLPEQTGREFLHQIVANGKNGLDVDKFDYLPRDARMCGISIGLNVNRLMQFSKVIDNEICYKWSEYHNVKQVYQTRLEMHQRVYGHRKARSVDLMVVDALRAANPVLKITDKIWDAKEFVKLDDTILKQIEFYGGYNPLWQLGDEDDSHILKAQSIIKRLRNRDLYRYCGECVIPTCEIESSKGSTGNWKPPNEQSIADLLPSGSRVGRDDIIVTSLRLNLTAGNSNPLDNVSFFDMYESTEKRVLKHSDMTALQLQNHEEHKLRVYSKKSDRKSCDDVQEAFERYVKEHFKDKEVMGTPRKQPTCDKLPNGSLANNSKKRKQLFGPA